MPFAPSAAVLRQKKPVFFGQPFLPHTLNPVLFPLLGLCTRLSPVRGYTGRDLCFCAAALRHRNGKPFCTAYAGGFPALNLFPVIHLRRIYHTKIGGGAKAPPPKLFYKDDPI